MEGFVEAPVNGGEDGPALTGVVAASIIPVSRKISIPAPFFSDVGRYIDILLSGRISTIGAAPGTLTLDVRLGGTVVFNGGASPTLVVSQTNLTWEARIRLWASVIGASAALKGVGHMLCPGLVANNMFMMPASAPANGNTFDATVPQALDVFGTFSVTGNSLTVHGYNVSWPT